MTTSKYPKIKKQALRKKKILSKFLKIFTLNVNKDATAGKYN